MRTFVFAIVTLLCTLPAAAGGPSDDPALPSLELPPELGRVLTDYEAALFLRLAAEAKERAAARARPLQA